MKKFLSKFTALAASGALFITPCVHGSADHPKILSLTAEQVTSSEDALKRQKTFLKPSATNRSKQY